MPAPPSRAYSPQTRAAALSRDKLYRIRNRRGRPPRIRGRRLVPEPSSCRHPTIGATKHQETNLHVTTIKIDRPYDPIRSEGSVTPLPSMRGTLPQRGHPHVIPVVLADAGTHPPLYSPPFPLDGGRLGWGCKPLPLPLSSRMRGPIPLSHAPVPL